MKNIVIVTSEKIGALIRLVSTSPAEEEVARTWATRLEGFIGEEILRLRPDTTLVEIFTWAANKGVDSMDFVFVFEPELRMAFAAFWDCPELVTFREMVEYCVAECR